jgi:hypothetical protein
MPYKQGINEVHMCDRSVAEGFRSVTKTYFRNIVGQLKTTAIALKVSEIFIGVYARHGAVSDR